MSDSIKFHCHPEYENNEDAWETYRDLFEGNHKTLISQKYLWAHELEFSNQQAAVDPMTQTSETVGNKIRRIRALRSRYFNLFEPVVSTWISMALSKPIKVDAETAEMLGEDINDIDGDGTSLENFIMGELAVSYFRDGKATILVDAPANTAVSQAEQRAAGFRPYMEVIDVLNLKDWQVSSEPGRHGKMDWVRYEYEVIGPRASATQEPEELEYCKVLQRDPVTGEVFVDVYLENEEAETWELVSSGQVLEGFSELPIAMAAHNVPWVKDVAELQLVLFNLMSAHYNLLNTQAFQRVFVSGDLQDKHLISISEYAVSILPNEAKPYVIEPSDTEALLKAIGSTMDQLYRVAFNRTRGVSSDSREAPGASTLREMSTELIALLIQAVGELESVINQALKHYAIFKLGPVRGQNFQGRVTLSRDITADDVYMQIQMFLAYRDEIRNVLPWRKAHLKKVAVSMGYNNDERLDIINEIDNLQPTAVAMPFSNPGGASPFSGSANGNSQQATLDQLEREVRVTQDQEPPVQNQAPRIRDENGR